MMQPVRGGLHKPGLSTQASLSVDSPIVANPADQDRPDTRISNLLFLFNKNKRKIELYFDEWKYSKTKTYLYTLNIYKYILSRQVVQTKELCQEFKLSKVWVIKLTNILKELNLIISKRGRGGYYTANLYDVFDEGKKVNAKFTSEPPTPPNNVYKYNNIDLDSSRNLSFTA
ncbi:MAG: hypothetical protein QXS54_03910, partial [Candidatus Methanomethylicaceae archaeon]